MAKIIRTKKGKLLLGVCKGLESSGRGNVIFWRIVFVLFSTFTFGIAIIIYFALAIIFPYDKSELS